MAKFNITSADGVNVDTLQTVSADNIFEVKNNGTDVFTVDQDGNILNSARNVLSGTEVDFSVDSIKTKTLSANTTLTIVNPVLGKTILLEIDSPAAETLGFPASVTVIDGSYDTGGAVNVIFLFCNDSATPEYLAVVKQKP